MFVDVPAQPVAPAVISKTDTAVTLEWTAPADHGDAITQYTLLLNNSNVISQIRVGLDTQCCVENLIPNTMYQFSVFAENSKGIGMPSAPTDVKTEEGISGNRVTGGNFILFQIPASKKFKSLVQIVTL